MKRFLCVALLLCLCLILASCGSSEPVIEYVEVIKEVEVPVEVIRFEVLKVPINPLTDAKTFDDYDWETLKVGDQIDDLLISGTGQVIKSFENGGEVVWKENGGALYYGYRISDITFSSVTIFVHPPLPYACGGLISGTISDIRYTYNTFGYIDHIYVTLE